MKGYPKGDEIEKATKKSTIKKKKKDYEKLEGRSFQ